MKKRRYSDITSKSLCDVVVVTNKDIFSRSLNSELKQGIENISIDDALDMESTFIAIKDKNVAKEVIKWITFGNFLHKSAVISSLLTFLFPRLIPGKYEKLSVLILGCSAIVATLTYNSCWMFDPCSKYQVEKRTEILSILGLPKKNKNEIYSLVLIRRDDYYRRMLHNFTMFWTTSKLFFLFSDAINTFLIETTNIIKNVI